MNRKKAIYTFATFHTLANFIIIALFLLRKLSLTGFAITLGVSMLIALGAAIIIIRKFPPME